MFYIWFNGEGYMSTYGKVDVTRYQDVGGGGFHFWSVYVQEGVCEVKILEGTYNLETAPWALMGPSWFKAWGDGLCSYQVVVPSSTETSGMKHHSKKNFNPT